MRPAGCHIGRAQGLAVAVVADGIGDGRTGGLGGGDVAVRVGHEVGGGDPVLGRDARAVEADDRGPGGSRRGARPDRLAGAEVGVCLGAARGPGLDPAQGVEGEGRATGADGQAAQARGEVVRVGLGPARVVDAGGQVAVGVIGEVLGGSAALVDELIGPIERERLRVRGALGRYRRATTLAIRSESSLSSNGPPLHRRSRSRVLPSPMRSASTPGGRVPMSQTASAR